MFKILLQIIFILIFLSFFGIIVYVYFNIAGVSSIENKYFDAAFSYLYIIGDYSINSIIPKVGEYFEDLFVWLKSNWFFYKNEL